MIPEEAKKIFITKYSSFGDEKFYKFLLNYAINKIIANEETEKDSPKSESSLSPAAELLDYHDKFLFLYRKESDFIYLEIARVFRKAAHKVYRIMLKKRIIEKSSKFLNTVD